MDHDEIAFLLERNPPAAILQPYRKQTGKRDQELADASMWEAIDRNDEDAMALALANGARPARLRNGIPPVWHCAQANQPGLIRQLIAAGADPEALAKGSSIWVAIAPRDSASEAEALSDIIGGIPRLDTLELARHGAWRMMAWAANKQGYMQSKWSQYKSDGMGEGQQEWINAAVHGPEEIIAFLSREWNVDADTPVEYLMGSGIVRGAWEQVAIRDDVDKARRLLRHGWLPPQEGNSVKMRDNRRPVSPLWQHGMAWVFLSKGAWNLWAWWMLSDKRRQEFNLALRQHPEQTLWDIADSKASVERLVALGIDLDVRDDRGNTLAHGLFSGKGLTKTLAQWWMDHRPQDLVSRNHDGLTPLEIKSDREPTLAWARAKWMSGQTSKATAVPTVRERF